MGIPEADLGKVPLPDRWTRKGSRRFSGEAGDDSLRVRKQGA